MHAERPCCSRRLARRAVLAPTVSAAGIRVAGQTSDDWTRWGGPASDFSITTGPVAATVPLSTPKLLWKRELGSGESAVLAQGSTLFTMYRDGSDEVVVALQADSGNTLWEHRYEAPVPEDLYVKHGDGPHAAPLIVGDRIFTVGISGKLRCLNEFARG